MPQTPFRNLQTDNEKATENTFRWLFSLLVQIETLLEAINTSAGVYQLLLTREEGVAPVSYTHLPPSQSLPDAGR